MSLRYFSARVLRNGRQLLHKYLYSHNISENYIYRPKSIVNSNAREIQSIPRYSAIKNVGISFGVQARKLLIDNILCKVSHGINLQVRQQIKRRFLFGDAVPLFSFVGISLASGSGILNREDEMEGLCWEVRNAVSKFQWTVITENGLEDVVNDSNVSLNNFEIGNPIAKGCSAVVYSARITDINGENSKSKDTTQDHFPIPEYPFALKMMFNYDIQSSSMAILSAMYRETIPAIKFTSHPENFLWEYKLNTESINLPPHPNIVTIYSAFADYVPQLPDSLQLYPDALPSRLNENGSGRNMTLFLLMKRYECSLMEYLRTHRFELRDSILMFTQLLEGIVHINRHGVAHRDLKTDNILIDSLGDETDSTPILVITDFGCCLADKVNGLRIPYRMEHMDKGGNVALMAPEIITQTPGHFSFLDYSKADLWAAGTIAYEIFGLSNPFYSIGNRSKTGLRNINYKECDLPIIDDKVPKIITLLIHNILNRNPNKRLSPEVATNVCQLFLWAPSAWLKSERLPSSQEILQWLLCMTSKVLCEARLGSSLGENQPIKKSTRRSHAEYILISSFLRRANLASIKQAITWMQSNV